MNYRNILTLAILTLLSLIVPVGNLAFSDTFSVDGLRPAKWQDKQAENQLELRSFGLRDLQGLDIDMYNRPPITGQIPGPDISFNIIQALTNNPTLPYRSPQDAFMALHCAGYDCTKIVAQIALKSQGGLPNGPVLWRHEESIFRYKRVPYYRRESSEIAESIVKALLSDYEQAKFEGFQSIGQSQNGKPGSTSPAEVQLPLKERIEP